MQATWVKIRRGGVGQPPSGYLYRLQVSQHKVYLSGTAVVCDIVLRTDHEQDNQGNVDLLCSLRGLEECTVINNCHLKSGNQTLGQEGVETLTPQVRHPHPVNDGLGSLSSLEAPRHSFQQLL